ncbi:ste ste11 protein kinase, partial [Moniliophthora roreri]
MVYYARLAPHYYMKASKFLVQLVGIAAAPHPVQVSHLTRTQLNTSCLVS